MSGHNNNCGEPSKKKAGPHDARSSLRASVKFGVSQCIKVSMQTLSSTSGLREKLVHKLAIAKSKQQRDKISGLLALLNELTAQFQARNGREYATAILPFDYALELYLGYQTGYVPNTVTQDIKIQFTETLLNSNTGLFVSIIRVSSLGKSYIVLRPPDGNMEPALDFILEELNNQQEEKKKI